jgi:histone H3/H4
MSQKSFQIGRLRDLPSRQPSNEKIKPIKSKETIPMFRNIVMKSKLTSSRPKSILEIINYQKTTHNLIPKLSFKRLVREIARNIIEDIRFQQEAVEALQVAAEIHLIELLREANFCALFTKRITLMDRDIRYVKRYFKPSVRQDSSLIQPLGRR